MTILGISVDPVERSVTLAQKEHIGFALLSDLDLVVAKQYVGADDHHLAVPGMVLIRRDHTIAYRKISDEKSDRLGARETLAIIDDLLGAPKTAAELHGGYTPTERLQVRLGFGGGAIKLSDGWHGDGRASLDALLPLDRHFLVGAGVTQSIGAGANVFDLDGALAARAPLLHDLGAVQLVVRGGRSVGDLAGWNVSARVGLGFTITPSWAAELAVETTTRWIGASNPAIDVDATLAITRLLQFK